MMEDRVRWDTWKKFFIVGVVRHWQKFPREAVGCFIPRSV